LSKHCKKPGGGRKVRSRIKKRKRGKITIMMELGRHMFSTNFNSMSYQQVWSSGHIPLKCNTQVKCIFHNSCFLDLLNDIMGHGSEEFAVYISNMKNKED
jgi:hypothetical protein